MRIEREQALRSGGGVVGHAALVVAEGYVHEYVAQRGFEADHQRFHIFAAFVAFFGGQQQRRMHAEVKALIIECTDGIADDLVRQLEALLISHEDKKHPREVLVPQKATHGRRTTAETGLA